MNRDQWDVLHEVTEHENRVWYELGYVDGLAAASVALEAALEAALAGSGYGFEPVSPTAKDVVRRLWRAVDRESRRPEPYTTPANGTALDWTERELFGRLAVTT